MFKQVKRPASLVAVASAVALLGAATACLLCCSAAQAKGHGQPGGGGGDGGGTAPYIIIPFAPDGVQFDSSGVFGLSDSGDVVGVVDTENGQVSYHLDLNTGAYTALLGRVWSVNNSGEIVGTVSGDPATDDGYYLSAPDAEPILLSPLPGDSWVDVYSINDSRMIVGDSFGTTGVTAVIWRPILNRDGTVTIDGPVPLLPLDGDSSSNAIDINAPVAGGPFEILGQSGSQAVIWTIDLNSDGTLSIPSDAVSLGTLDGIRVSGYAINSLGAVCGSCVVPIFKPFDGPAQPLNVVRNTSWGRAMDINDVGQMVGQIETVSKSNSYRLSAYLWKGVDADPVDLEKLIDKNSGWDLTYANYINKNGDIAGNGYYNGVPTGLGFIMVAAP